MFQHVQEEWVRIVGEREEIWFCRRWVFERAECYREAQPHSNHSLQWDLVPHSLSTSHCVQYAVVQVHTSRWRWWDATFPSKIHNTHTQINEHFFLFHAENNRPLMSVTTSITERMCSTQFNKRVFVSALNTNCRSFGSYLLYKVKRNSLLVEGNSSQVLYDFKWMMPEGFVACENNNQRSWQTLKWNFSQQPTHCFLVKREFKMMSTNWSGKYETLNLQCRPWTNKLPCHREQPNVASILAVNPTLKLEDCFFVSTTILACEECHES